MAILTAKVPEELVGMRLDQALAEMFSDYSRSKLQTWIKAGRVTVNGQLLKARDKVDGGEDILLDAEPEKVVEAIAEPIALEIIYEDDDLLIINKPAGLVVHPGAGNPNGTLLNALLYHDGNLAQLPRSGIVHRIDKETTGLLMVAKTLASHTDLVEQLQNREIEREYQAIIQGRMTAGETIDQPIGRHPVDYKRFMVKAGGRDSVTHYRVLQRLENYTVIKVILETGRTHQIRVHMEHIRYPLVGDPLYGRRFGLPRACSPALEEALRAFKRQALHAAKLGLIHPTTKEHCQWEIPMPEDMQILLTAMETHDREHPKR